MKKSKRNIRLIGNLQVYAEPYASIYYDFHLHIFNLVIQVSHVISQLKYLEVKITPDQIFKYFEQEIGLKSIIQSSENQYNLLNSDIKTLDIEDFPRIDISSLIKDEQLYDPDFCFDELEIIHFVNKHKSLNI